MRSDKFGYDSPDWSTFKTTIPIVPRYQSWSNRDKYESCITQRRASLNFSVAKVCATCVCQATITSTSTVSLVEGPVLRSTQQMILPVIRMTVPVFMGVQMVGMENCVTRDVHHSVSTVHVTEMMAVVLLTTVDMIPMGVASKCCHRGGEHTELREFGHKFSLYSFSL